MEETKITNEEEKEEQKEEIKDENNPQSIEKEEKIENSENKPEGEEMKEEENKDEEQKEEEKENPNDNEENEGNVEEIEESKENNDIKNENNTHNKSNHINIENNEETLGQSNKEVKDNEKESEINTNNKELIENDNLNENENKSNYYQPNEYKPMSKYQSYNNLDNKYNFNYSDTGCLSRTNHLLCCPTINSCCYDCCTTHCCNCCCAPSSYDLCYNYPSRICTNIDYKKYLDEKCSIKKDDMQDDKLKYLNFDYQRNKGENKLNYNICNDINTLSFDRCNRRIYYLNSNYCDNNRIEYSINTPINSCPFNYNTLDCNRKFGRTYDDYNYCWDKTY